MSETRTIEINTDACTNCLFMGTTKPVPGCGNADNKLVIIGRDPGRYEEQFRVPFVGRSGVLLNDALQRTGLKREDFYVTNVVKCRPKRNKTPPGKVVDQCISHLMQEMMIIRPRLVLFLGKDAQEIEGKIKEYCPVDCIFVHAYHPAAILRNLSLYDAFEKQIANTKKLIDTLR